MSNIDPSSLLQPETSITLSDIQLAQNYLKGKVFRTPLVPLNHECSDKKIFLKLENLQPIGCYKLRGACNGLRHLNQQQLRDGIYTASAGNFAQGLAWNAKLLNIPCRILVPENAPESKVRAIEALGGVVTKLSRDAWWKVLVEKHHPGMEGHFIHPVVDNMVRTGNGTIGLEILEDLDQLDAVIVPYGGGGLSSGIAAAVKALSPNTKVYACEVETAAPFQAALNAGKPVDCKYVSSFVDGIGSSSVLEEMWPIVQNSLDGSLVVSLQQIVDAIKLVAERNHVIAEGAGAAPVAAALAGLAGTGNIACIISGGNIDIPKLIKILQGQVPK